MVGDGGGAPGGKGARRRGGGGEEDPGEVDLGVGVVGFVVKCRNKLPREKVPAAEAKCLKWRFS